MSKELTIFSFSSLSQILKPAEKKQKYVYGGLGQGRPVTPPRKPKKKWKWLLKFLAALNVFTIRVPSFNIFFYPVISFFPHFSFFIPLMIKCRSSLSLLSTVAFIILPSFGHLFILSLLSFLLFSLFLASSSYRKKEKGKEKKKKNHSLLTDGKHHILLHVSSNVLVLCIFGEYVLFIMITPLTNVLKKDKNPVLMTTTKLFSNVGVQGEGLFFLVFTLFFSHFFKLAHIFLILL